MTQSKVSNYKRLSLALAFCLSLGHSFTIHCSAQTYFNKNVPLFSPLQTEAARSILSADSNYIVIGSTGYPQNINLYRIALIRLSLAGDIKQLTFIGDTVHEYYSGVGTLLKTTDNSFAFAGTIRAYGDTIDDQAAIFKFNSNLQLDWIKQFGNTDNIIDTVNVGRGLCQTAEGYYMLTGEQYYYGDYSEFYLQKADIDGNCIWRNTYWFGGVNSGFSVIATTDGGHALGGYRYYPGPNVKVDPLVVKTDSLGNLEWYADIGSEYDDDLACVALAQDGNILAATIKADSLNQYLHVYKRYHMVKMANNGNELWSRSYGNSRTHMSINKMRTLDDGRIIACGVVPDLAPNRVGWIWLFTPDGDSLWYREYELLGGANSMNFLYDVTEAPDGGFAACGVLYPFLPDTSNMDAWVLKVDSLGCEGPDDCWVGIHPPAPPSIIAANGKLSLQPNPATTETWVTWQGEASLLEVFNASGVRVCQCKLPPEQTQFRLNTYAWPHGLYLLRLFMKEGHAITTKMMKL